MSALAGTSITVLGGLAIHTFVVYPIALRLAAGVSPVEFFRRVRTVMLTAFSTSSSNATLPTALRVSEANLGVPTRDRRVRPDGRRDREPERHGALRGRRRCCFWRNSQGWT